MKSLGKLFIGFFADQNGNGSRKAMAMYISFFFLWIMVNGSLEGKVIDPYILGSIFVIILFTLGAITTEWITKNYKNESLSNSKS